MPSEINRRLYFCPYIYVLLHVYRVFKNALIRFKKLKIFLDFDFKGTDFKNESGCDLTFWERSKMPYRKRKLEKIRGRTYFF